MSTEEKVKAEGGSGSTEHIVLRVRDQTGEEIQFKVKPTTKMEKILNAYADRKGVSVAALRFMVDGERINPTDTPSTLELENDDQVDVR